MQNNEDVSEKNCECRKSAIERHINTNWRSLLFSASRNITLATKRNSLTHAHTHTWIRNNVKNEKKREEFDAHKKKESSGEKQGTTRKN